MLLMTTFFKDDTIICTSAARPAEIFPGFYHLNQPGSCPVIFDLARPKAATPVINNKRRAGKRSPEKQFVPLQKKALNEPGFIVHRCALSF